jgi:hypothetical protein
MTVGNWGPSCRPVLGVTADAELGLPDPAPADRAAPLRLLDWSQQSGGAVVWLDSAGG